MILREHIEEFGTAADGRLFRTATGGMIYDHTATWAAARTFALTPEQVASPMAARPYDLRHGAVSLWLNGGVAVTEVADRAGHVSRFCCGCTRSASMAARRSLTGGSMRHWQPDRSTMQEAWYLPAPVSFALRPAEMRQDPSRLYPATSDIGGSWLHLAAAEDQVTTRGRRHISPGQAWFYQVERRAWDSNPRGRSPP